jgi:hypothetical protein
VYAWIWRRLPGRRPAKITAAVALLAAAVALLFLVVFPYVEPRLPFNQVTVTPHGGDAPNMVPAGPSGASTGGPSRAPSGAPSATRTMTG